jgi:putative ABC transport system ATP-binding protein
MVAESVSSADPQRSPTPLAGLDAPPAVICRGVTKDFGDGETKVRALDKVTVSIRSGEMSLLVGPSGCGKTTLISIIAGLLHPTEGDVELFGTVQSQLKPRQLVDFRAKNVGFVFQQYNLLPALTAAENVAVPLLIQGQPRPAALRKAKSMLDRVELANRRDQFPSQLSGGQQQRVAIARALVHEPRLLVCDEPTAALDGHSGQVVMTLIQQVVVQPGRAVIVVTHDHRIFGFGARVIEMADGTVVDVRDQSHEQMQEHDAVAAAGEAASRGRRP